MKLTFNSPTVQRGLIPNAATDPKVGAVFHAPFSQPLARALGVLAMLYDTEQKPAVIRTFPSHGIDVEIPEASIEFQRPASPNGKAGKVKVLAGACKVTEVYQEKLKDATVTRIAFRVVFGGDAKLDAFDLLFGGEPGEWKAISVKGQQAELDFEGSEEEGAEEEPAEA